MNYLNPSDLMVCDYVFRDGYGIAEVIKVCGTSVRVQLVSDGKIMTWSKMIEPIPLTAEMLEKNSFGEPYSNVKDFSQMSYKDEDGFAHAYIYGKMIEINIVGYNELPYRKFDAAIYYVHECQHILRDCGMRKLANNFKI